MTGHPSLALPAGFFDGMPRGMALIGKLWEESVLMGIGHAYQGSTDWHRERPPLDG